MRARFNNFLIKSEKINFFLMKNTFKEKIVKLFNEKLNE